MSVYKPKGSPYYHFDFQCRGHRFYGSTGRSSKREALAVENEERSKAKESLKNAKAAKIGGPMIMDVAIDKWWLEVAQHYNGTYGTTMKAACEWLLHFFGPSTLIRDINTRRISEAVQKRRGEVRIIGDGKPDPTGRKVSNSTVNRTVTEPLRRLLRRARRVWEQDVQEVDWAELLLAEPKERVRELRDSEERDAFMALRPDYHPILHFALKTGCRLNECVGLRWRHVDWGNRTITIFGKGGKVATIPLSADVRDLLWPLQGHHQDNVFTYVGRSTRGGRTKGGRYPITYSGLKTEWRRCKVRGKIEDFRFHDNRHTAATRLLRETGNLKLVQKLLRHEDITTTAKYAHAHDDDLRNAMEAVHTSRSEKFPAEPAARAAALPVSRQNKR